MNDDAVIDLCDSSADEGECVAIPSKVQATSQSPSEKIVASKSLAKPATKVCFWDSSSSEDEDEGHSDVTIITAKNRQQRRRRLSKVVTPEDARSKKAPSSSEYGDAQSDTESSPIDKNHHESKRKQPRILFSKGACDAGDGLARQPPVNLEHGQIQLSTSAVASRVNDNLEMDDSSSDEDFLSYTSVFSKRKKPQSNAVPNQNQPIIGSSHNEESLHTIMNDGNVTNGDNQEDKAKKKIDPAHAVVVRNPYMKRPAANVFMVSKSLSQSHHHTRQLLEYPNIGPVSCRQYEDVRAKYLLAFWTYSRTLVSASYNLKKLDHYCRQIRDLALSTDFPIRSLEEYVGGGTSHETASLQDVLKAGGVDRIATRSHRNAEARGYYSIPEAALVAMLEHVERNARVNGVNLTDESKVAPFCRSTDQWLFLADLIPQIDSRLNTDTAPALLGRKGDRDHGEAFYCNPSTRSAEFKQLDLLTKPEAKSDTSFLKTHRKDKRVCYELTERGYQKALCIRSRRFPEEPGYLRTSKLFSDSVDPCFRGICLVVDCREGGGPTKKLHSLCKGLDMRKVPYIVTKLDIGDYAFVTTDTQKLLPILLERKSIQDVAQSIWDGRWVSQKMRMYHGQYVFGFHKSRLAYVIEGHANGQELTNGAIGHVQYQVHRTQLDAEIGNLEAEGFEVFTTNNLNGSLAKLVELSKSVANDYRDGKLNAEMSYEDFIQRIKNIPSGVDFSKVAKDHQRQRITNTRDASQDNVDTIPPGDLSRNVSAPKCNTTNESVVDDTYESWKLQQLKAECEKYGLPKTGRKEDLVQRLRGPRPPKAWLQRKKANLYVPTRFDSCGSAILVAIWLHQRRENSESWKGLEKDDIITVAESLKISKDPFTGTGKGSFDYDGWSCMGPLKEGQSPLVWRQKGGFFKLTTVGGEESGFQVAGAIHKWCHDNGKCLCTELGFT